MTADYADSWLTITDSGLAIRAYYFPWGTKHIEFASIRSLERVSMTAVRGRGRIWGTANPKIWAGLDPGRPTKQVGFVLDLGRSVRPFVTPNDPSAFEASLRSRCELPPPADPPGHAPIV